MRGMPAQDEEGQEVGEGDNCLQPSFFFWCLEKVQREGEKGYSQHPRHISTLESREGHPMSSQSADVEPR